jgi:hypothetical protein
VHVLLLIYHIHILFIGINLNLPLDEFGAVDFDYVQNLVGKHSVTSLYYEKACFILYICIMA